MRRRGASVIEVIVAVSMMALFAASVSTALARVERVNASSQAKTQALNYAREGIELVTSIQHALFRCTNPGGGTCALDGQAPCSMLPGYTSCWAQFPDDGNPANGTALTALTGLKLERANGTWILAAGAPAETLGTNPVFTRYVDIVNQPDPAGAGYFNIKQVTVRVEWLDGNATRTVSATTTLTGWKNS